MKTQETHSPLAAILMIAMATPLLHAGTLWDGGGADDLFGTGENWDPDGSPPVGDTVDLTFAGNVRLTPVNNYTDWDDFRNIDFAAGAGAFAITGNPVDLHGRVENQSDTLQTLSLTLAIQGSQGTRGEFNPVGGDLLINGSDIFTNGHTLQVWGGNGHTVTFDTVISGDGGLSVNQNSNVVLIGANSYTGTTAIHAGTLSVGNGGAAGQLGTGAVSVATGSSLIFNRSDDITVTNAISGDGAVVKNGDGILTFSTQKQYTGGTTVNAGILNLATGGESGVIRGTLTINAGAEAHLSANDATGWGTGDQRISAININGGILRINTTGGSGQNQTFSNLAITMNGGTISGAVAGSTFDFFNGGSSLTTLASADTATVSVNARLRQANTTFTVADGEAAVDLLWSSTLSQEGTGRNFIKAGNGRMDLTGAGTYSGSTTIDGGTLRVTNQLRSTSSVTVNAGAILETAATNIFTDGHGSAMGASRTITVNGGTWLMASGDGRIGNVTLNNGATWTSNVNTGYGMLLANLSDGNAATVTVGGSGASTMNGTGALRLQGIQNFHVNDVTGSADTDLTVSLIVQNPGTQGGAAGGIRKTGDGTMLLNNLSNNFNGDIIISAGRIVTGTSQGGGTNSYLGVVNGSRTITVESGGVLDYRANNIFGGGGKTAATIPAIVLDGGTLTSTRFNIVGNLTMNGGTLTQSASDSGSYEGYQFLGTVTVGGDSASTISTGNNKANHLLGSATTVFNVADATGDAAADLIVSAALRNGSGDYSGIGSLEKTGEGTMLLDAANTYTGTTVVSAGTLLVNGSLAASAITVSSGAAFGGIGAVGGSISFDGGSSFHIADLGNPLAIGGTITFGSGFDVTNLTGIDWDSLDLLTPYTLISTSQTFTASDIGSFGIDNALSVGNEGRLAYFDNGSLTVIVIPEPASIMLGSLGLLTLLRRRR